MKRRLAAILAADVLGYSRLMGEDEAGTLERVKFLRRELVQPNITERKGRIVKLVGDGLLAVFPSVANIGSWTSMSSGFTCRRRRRHRPPPGLGCTSDERWRDGAVAFDRTSAPPTITHKGGAKQSYRSTPCRVVFRCLSYSCYGNER